MKEKRVLGIETSCDDTSICILEGSVGDYKNPPKILAHSAFSQETILRKWGGVVPEIAARNHLLKLTPLLQETFEKANTTPNEIDLIGVTTHPGLLGPLLTGLNGAKTLSLMYKTPINPINHLYAHLEAIHLTEKIEYPYLGLLVSGGNSMYQLVKSPTEFEVLGSTIDDAAGEAFDKGGKLLGFGYPAGRIIDENSKKGDHKRFEFPVALKGSKDANLSFSGLKTSLRTFLQKNENYKFTGNYNQDIYDVCASYQWAITEALSLKLKYALKKAKEITKTNLKVVVGGGVACNSALRSKLAAKFSDVYFVKPNFCTDNGAMIANYALRTYEKAVSHPECLTLDARSRLTPKKKQK